MTDLAKGQTLSEVTPPAVVWAVVLGAAFAILPLMVGPLLVGEYARALGLTEAESGALLSLEMLGLTLGALMLIFALRFDWRRLLYLAICLLIAGNALAALAASFEMLTLTRFMAGLGSGILMTLTIQVIALMRSPDSIYGVWSVGQIAMGVLWIVLLPRLLPSIGLAGIFLLWAFCGLMLVFTVAHYPQGRSKEPSPQIPTVPPTGQRVGWLCLAGLVVYYAGQAGVWAFFEALGTHVGLPLEIVQNGLLLSLVAAAAGSAVAIVMGDSKGRMLPLVCSMTLSAVAIGFLQFMSDGEWFFLAACLFNFAWYFFLPYISATVAAIDDSGQFLTLLAVAFPLSLAAGPAFASFLLGWSDSLSNVLIFGLCSVPIGISLILPAARTASTPKDPVTTL